MTWYEWRFVPLAILVPLAGIIFTLTEMRYMLFANVAEGTIVSVEEAFRQTSRGARPNGQLVTVTFTDTANDQTRQAQGRFHALWKPESESLQVQYIPGDAASGRLAEDAHPIIAVVILGVTLLLTIAAVKFGIEAGQPVGGRKRKRNH